MQIISYLSLGILLDWGAHNGKGILLVKADIIEAHTKQKYIQHDGSFRVLKMTVLFMMVTRGLFRAIKSIPRIKKPYSEL